MAFIESEICFFNRSTFIIFTFVFMGFSRVLKDAYGNPNTGSAIIASLAFSFLATYGISRTRFDLGYLLFQLENSGALLIIIVAAVAVGVIYILSRFSRRKELRFRAA